MVFKYDFLIIGAGVAGMSYALKVARAHKGKVCMICKTSLDEANTSFAQGGVASVTNLAVDNFDKHIEDTMIAGDFISDRRAVEQVVRNAPEQIAELVKWGVNFDRKENGEFDLHREGGHSEFRIRACAPRPSQSGMEETNRSLTLIMPARRSAATLFSPRYSPQ